MRLIRSPIAAAVIAAAVIAGHGLPSQHTGGPPPAAGWTSSQAGLPPPPAAKLASRCLTGGSQPGQMSVTLWTTSPEVPVYVATVNIALNWSSSPGNNRMVTEPVNREVSRPLPAFILTYPVAAVNGSYPDECWVQGYASGTPSPSSSGWLRSSKSP